MSLLETMKAVETQLGKPDISKQLQEIGTRVDAAIAEKNKELAVAALKEARTIVEKQEAGDAKTVLEKALAEEEAGLKEQGTNDTKREDRKELKAENNSTGSQAAAGIQGAEPAKVAEVAKPLVAETSQTPTPPTNNSPTKASWWSNPFADFASWNPFKGISDRWKETFSSPVVASKTAEIDGFSSLTEPLQQMGNDIDNAGKGRLDGLLENLGWGSPKTPPPATV